MEIKNYINEFSPLRASLEKMELQQRKAAQAKTNNSGSSDKVSLSSEGRLRTEAFQAAMSAPEVREAKVEAIRKKIADGTYTVDTKKIAERLLTEEAELFKI
ncbi:flagellar biosynthesis anti-sigma factor FlgM [Desulfovibrio litoralis]|uniref:Negative regulator of flagellin synthesis n=1 Tax=Desulfovibrio litoralis DSM 11393 TaxID=1121455 RepID=A0A1M7T690_9BACT|nr:flagellar biosynthesis anti-sigma factor FlgM [Desulfovibrio litoralis]SHN66264.1 anti-sigma-28 factor, FlgM family [Desulfovibrio litoralis DSM 11393]